METILYTFLTSSLIGLLIGIITSRIIVAIILHAFPDCHQCVKKRLNVPLSFLLGAIFAYIGFIVAGSICTIPEDSNWFKGTQTGVSVGLIILFCWVLVQVLKLWEDIAFIHLQKKYPGSQKIKNRKTQVTTLSRVFTPIIIILCVLIALWIIFPALKSLGSALLASAGIASVVLGIAAQSTLSNVFSGIQIALSGSIRLDDYVKVGSDKGVVESITTIYVIIRLWDDRRILVPSSLFTSNAFENWSLEQDQMHTTIDFDLGWNVPIQDLREVLNAVLKAEPLWDGRKGELIVSSATNGFIKVRAIVSASTPQDAINLEASVREKIVQWIQNNSLQSTQSNAGLVANEENAGQNVSPANKMKKI